MNNKVRTEAQKLFLEQGLNCAQSVIKGVFEVLDVDYDDSLISMAQGFGRGVGGSGCICGALNGGVMALGYVNSLKGNKLLTKNQAKTLHEQFVLRNRCTCCRVLSAKYPKGSPEAREQCARFVADVAADVVDLLEP